MLSQEPSHQSVHNTVLNTAPQHHISSRSPSCLQMLLASLRDRTRSESGFMGLTHALSAVAVLAVILPFRKEWLISVVGTDSAPFIVLLFLVVIGGALMPDLDNTNSSAESALGFIGSGISAFMRLTAPIIQGLIHTRYDKDTDNPHRGFYHTALSAVLAGGIFAFLCGPTISVPIGDIVVIDGKRFALILAFIGAHIALSTLGEPLLAKLKSAAGLFEFLVPTAVSAVIVGALWSQLPDTGVNYAMIGVAYGFGWLIHILGDMFTVQGVPVLFPFPIHGKMWWHVRLLKIKAGGVVENLIFIPLFLIITLVCVWYAVMQPM